VVVAANAVTCALVGLLLRNAATAIKVTRNNCPGFGGNLELTLEGDGWDQCLESRAVTSDPMLDFDPLHLAKLDPDFRDIRVGFGLGPRTLRMGISK
jgi:hypothetical protein